MTSKKTIFKKGSRTYYNTSIFFPKEVRRDVFVLYAFVRTADDLVDSVPQKKREFFEFKKNTSDALQGKKINDHVIDDFVELCKRKKFRKTWIDAFLKAMEQDLKEIRFKELKQTEQYIYGSAEVIGLFMAKIMNLERKSYKSAMMLGKAMQYINFIRDIKEDAERGRTYLPLREANKHGLKNLDLKTVEENTDAFKEFIKAQIQRFYEYDEEARKGFKHIPKRFLTPIKTAQDMYLWTAQRIEKNPLIVLRKKVKPSKRKIISAILKNYFFKGEK